MAGASELGQGCSSARLKIAQATHVTPLSVLWARPAWREVDLNCHVSLVKNKMDHREKSSLTKEPVLDGDPSALCLLNRSLCPSLAVCFQGRVLTYVLEVLW